VLEADDKGESPAGTFRNIRIVGQGTIDGNGWTRGVKSGGEATIIDEMGNALPQYRASNAKKSARTVFWQSIRPKRPLRKGLKAIAPIKTAAPA
jgi:hypothetical protein